MNQDPFFKVPRTVMECSAGEVKMPIFYHDASNVLALFTAPLKAVQAELHDTGLKPAVVLGKRAVVGVSLYEYRVTSVGPYNEVGVAVPVFREGQPRPALGTLDLLRSAGEQQLGFYILDLPVTTDVANAAGREFWGFPKFVTDIEFRWWRGKFHCQVMEPGSDRVIMRFTGQPRPMIPLPATDMVLYSHRDGDMLRSLINIRHGMSWNFPAGMRLETGTGEHPMGERLRRLGLCGRRPFAVLSTRQFESRLNAGVPVEEVATV